MMPRWTAEARAAQSERIRRQRPWLHATGPKTPEGKRKVSRNALKHGARSAQMARIFRYLKAQKHFMRRIQAETRLRRAKRLAEMRLYKALRLNSPPVPFMGGERANIWRYTSDWTPRPLMLSP